MTEYSSDIDKTLIITKRSHVFYYRVSWLAGGHSKKRRKKKEKFKTFKKKVSHGGYAA